MMTKSDWFMLCWLATLLIILAASAAREIFLRRSLKNLEAMRASTAALARTMAFAAGYRTAQRFFGCGVPLSDWENEERLNAIKNGFTTAEQASLKEDSGSAPWQSALAAQIADRAFVSLRRGPEAADAAARAIGMK